MDSDDDDHGYATTTILRAFTMRYESIHITFWLQPQSNRLFATLPTIQVAPPVEVRSLSACSWTYCLACPTGSLCMHTYIHNDGTMFGWGAGPGLARPWLDPWLPTPRGGRSCGARPWECQIGIPIRGHQQRRSLRDIRRIGVCASPAGGLREPLRAGAEWGLRKNPKALPAYLAVSRDDSGTFWRLLAVTLLSAPSCETMTGTVLIAIADMVNSLCALRHRYMFWNRPHDALCTAHFVALAGLIIISALAYCTAIARSLERRERQKRENRRRASWLSNAWRHRKTPSPRRLRLRKTSARRHLSHPARSQPVRRDPMCAHPRSHCTAKIRLSRAPGRCLMIGLWIVMIVHSLRFDGNRCHSDPCN